MTKDHDDNAKLYVFDPLSSITVYELSQVIKHLNLMITEETLKAMPPLLRANFQEMQEFTDGDDH